jgi:glycosyl transferase, family 25
VRLPVDSIYYISLKKAALRRHKLVQHLTSLAITDKHGTPAMWHLANDGNRINHRIDNSIKIANKRSNMSLGEIGCCASHREIWQRQVDEGRKFVLILEDDARFHVSKLRNLLLNWDLMPHFDFLHLGWEYYAGYKMQDIRSRQLRR